MEELSGHDSYVMEVLEIIKEGQNFSSDSKE